MIPRRSWFLGSSFVTLAALGVCFYSIFTCQISTSWGSSGASVPNTLAREMLETVSCAPCSCNFSNSSEHSLFTEQTADLSDSKADCFVIKHGDISIHKPTVSKTLQISPTVNFPDHRIRPFLYFRKAVKPFTDYMITLASPDQDPFSARFAEELNSHEWHVEEAFAQALEGKCDKQLGRVLDCGANIGTTMSLAASMGCHVIAYEMQPRMHFLMNLTVLANGWTDRVLVKSGVTVASGNSYGPFRYTPLGTADGYPNPNLFPTIEGSCPEPDGRYCEKAVSLVNILDDFNGDIELVKLDTDSNELELMSALIGKMKETGFKINNWIIEGNNPRQLAPEQTPVYELCVTMHYHTFLLDNPKLEFYTPVAQYLHRVTMKGYIHDAYYIKDGCSGIVHVLNHIRHNFNAYFVGNLWLTNDENLLKILVV